MKVKLQADERPNVGPKNSDINHWTLRHARDGCDTNEIHDGAAMMVFLFIMLNLQVDSYQYVGHIFWNCCIWASKTECRIRMEEWRKFAWNNWDYWYWVKKKYTFTLLFKPMKKVDTLVCPWTVAKITEVPSWPWWLCFEGEVRCTNTAAH